MLRSLAQGLAAGSRGFAAASGPRVTSVYEKVVSFWLVDHEGRRRKVAGIEGDSVAQAIADHVPPRSTLELVSGSKDVHVILPKEWADTIPAPSEAEKARIYHVAYGDGSMSRLGSAVVLKKVHEGMTLAVGGAKPSAYDQRHEMNTMSQPKPPGTPC
ncbi:unnamed protein product [Pedinophyceae sp. YPF-701]|nr:unnamed protein product [Pedinophyceae sp. YPF-701]